MGVIPEKFEPVLFNSPLEAGLRAVIILEAFEPSQFDIATISILDYYLVHTGDADGPESVHPDIAPRGGEYLIRRHLIEQGIALMMRASLIEQVPTAAGITFRSHETAAAMLDMVGTTYNKRLIDAGSWLAEKSRKEGQNNFIRDLKIRIDWWSQEVIEGSIR